MRNLLIALMLFASSAFSAPFTITIDDANAPCIGEWGIHTVGVNTFAVRCEATTSPPIVQPTPPVNTSMCTSYPKTVNFGEFKFNGARVVSENVTQGVIAYGVVKIPNPLPEGWHGRKAVISVYEYASAKIYRQVYFNKSPCDFSTIKSNFSIGTGSNIYVSFGVDRPGYTTVQPGEAWYLNVKHEYSKGVPSCFSTISCNFAVNAGIPSL